MGLVQARGVDIPKPPLLPADAASRLQALLGDRTEFFRTQNFQEGDRQFDYFAAERLWQERRPLLGQLDRQLLAARVVQNRSVHELQKMSKLATGTAGAGMGPAVAAAEANLRDAQRAMVAAQARRDQFVVRQMAPLEQYLKQARPAWTTLYSKLGRLVPRDATDPLAPISADIWKAAGRFDDGLVEAHVLGAVAFLYAGKLDEAEEHLERASRVIREAMLYELPVAIDCCHAWLLLGKPWMCREFVGDLKNLPDTATTIGQDWAIGLHEYAERKLHDGAKHFIRAVGNAIDMRKRLEQEAPPAMWGDAVVALLQVDAGNAGRARSFFAKAGPAVVNDGCWQMLRARAMMAADVTDWRAAVDLLEVCVERAPGPMRPELADQLAAYRQQKLWNVRDWRPSAAAGGAVPQAAVPQSTATEPADDSRDPRYAYDGRFPESDFRRRFVALQNATDVTSLLLWRELLRALFDSGLTLNDIDWAEHCRDDANARRAFTAEEAITFKKYEELMADGW
ncbi:MAG: hypothetical protein ACKO6B_00960 [Planctomycetia bacterium]